jgi:anti-sigma regulatory factor (Ser/Thr protein kinase)
VNAPGAGPRSTPSNGSAVGTVPQDGLSLRLSGGFESAALARRAVARLRGDLESPVTDNMRLLVTELVTNSVRHARARAVGLKAVVTSSAVWVEVSDEGPGFGREARRSQPDEESGWGLFLVERLSDRWGVTKDSGQTRVWFELRR